MLVTLNVALLSLNVVLLYLAVVSLTLHPPTDHIDVCIAPAATKYSVVLLLYSHNILNTFPHIFDVVPQVLELSSENVFVPLTVGGGIRDYTGASHAHPFFIPYQPTSTDNL